MMTASMQSASAASGSLKRGRVVAHQLRTRVAPRRLERPYASVPAGRAVVEVIHTSPAAAEALLPTILDVMGEAFRTDDLQELLGIPADKRDILFKQLTAALLKGHWQDKGLSLLGLLSSGVGWIWSLLTSIPLNRLHILVDVWDTLKEEEVALKEAGVDQYMKVVILGTHPSAQGQGLGSAVLKAISADADAAGLPLYLEAASRDAARLYERQGYEIVKTVLEGGKEVFLMLRQPGQQG